MTDWDDRLRDQLARAEANLDPTAEERFSTEELADPGVILDIWNFESWDDQWAHALDYTGDGTLVMTVTRGDQMIRFGIPLAREFDGSLRFVWAAVTGGRRTEPDAKKATG